MQQDSPGAARFAVHTKRSDSSIGVLTQHNSKATDCLYHSLRAHSRLLRREAYQPFRRLGRHR